MGPESVTFSTRDLTNMVLREDNNGHKGTRAAWVPAGEGQNKGTQIWANGRLHAMLFRKASQFVDEFYYYVLLP